MAHVALERKRQTMILKNERVDKLKKLLSLLLVVGLVVSLMVGMVSAAVSVIAGNEVIHRPLTDGRSNFYVMDRNNPFTEDSIMTGWSVYVSAGRAFKFMVYKEFESGWQVVYESAVMTKPAGEVYNHTLDNFIEVGPNHYVGVYFQGTGAVPYTASNPHHEFGTTEHTTLFTASGAIPVAFTESGERIYSLQAHGFAMPVATWLPPISLDHFELNETATLPIKFKLDGNYDYVKLLVGEQEIALKQEWDEEHGDFYLGLFKPSEAGDFTAKVLVSGVCVKDITFNVFEVAPRGNGQGKK